jgi:hypothetical protein
MAAKERIAIRHPKEPGFVKTVTRRQLAGYERRGWVEAKSPAAKALVETPVPGGGPPAPLHKED